MLSPAEFGVPATSAQRRLWFLEQLRPGSAEYLVPAHFALQGELDLDALGRALDAVVRAHEALRTRFIERDGEPVCVVMPADGPAPLRVIDLSGRSPQERDAAVGDLVAADRQPPFDLERDPLIRATVIRIGPLEHRLLLCMHHAIIDGWSLSLVANELATRYREQVGATPCTPRVATMQAGDVALMEHDRLNAVDATGRVPAAASRLEGLPSLGLVTDRPRPPVKSAHGARHYFDLSPELVANVSTLAVQLGATPFMVGLAAFEALLHRHTGQDDFGVGSPYAARETQELEPVVGLLAGTLVLRADLCGDPTFAELVGRVRDDALDAFRDQDVPFERLVKQLAPERDPSQSPLFQVAFVLQNVPPFAELDFGSVRGAVRDMTGATAKFDLTLTMHENRRGLRGELEYATELFDGSTAQALAGRYRALLGCGVAAPDRPVSALQLCSDRSGFRAEPVSAEPGEPVHRRVERTIGRTPEVVAITDGSRQLSYGQLGERAQELTDALRATGAGPDRTVGVCLERSLRLPVALLGVLESGAAYVPLDPVYPSHRLTATLGDAGVCALVTSHELRGRFGGGGLPVLTLDEDGRLENGAIDASVPARRPQTSSPSNLAYVIYTSGSTGRPKGVAVEHASLANLVDWHLRAYGTGPGDRTTLVASPGFDASVWELWPALVAGATVLVPADEVRADPVALVRFLAEQRATETFLPTPLAEAVLAVPQVADLVALRYLLTGGDVLRRLPPARAPFKFVNHYGPTECTVVATATPITADSRHARPPIGDAIDGVQAFVLDTALAPVPDGVVGELCLGGAGVARGYVGNPEQTAQSFVDTPAGRIYRTGDRVRRGRDGQLHFLGRTDDQIKVRGYRIEPAEVEGRLRAHPAVTNVVVSVRPEAGSSQQELAAFVVLRDGAPKPTAAEFGRFVRERLPSHMVPASFVLIDAVPLTMHGKLDRRALGRQSGELLEQVSDVDPPHSATEHLVAEVWCDLLELPAVGVRSSFFEVGGHSFLTVKVQQRLRARLSRDVPMVALFEHPTVASLAAYLDGATTEAELDRGRRDGAALRRQRRARARAERS